MLGAPNSTVSVDGSIVIVCPKLSTMLNPLPFNMLPCAAKPSLNSLGFQDMFDPAGWSWLFSIAALRSPIKPVEDDSQNISIALFTASVS